MASLLMRATSLVGLPVVTTTTGEAIAETRDVIYVPDLGRVVGFTLNKRGRFAGRIKHPLAMSRIHAVGRDAVMVRDAAALEPGSPESGEESDAVGAAQESKGRNVIGNFVLTDAGKQLGTVRDLIVELNQGGLNQGGLNQGGLNQGGLNRGDVIGYELDGDPGVQRAEGAPMLLPLPATLAVSGDVLMVPADVEEFIRDDLAGFGSAVSDFRSRLGGA